MIRGNISASDLPASSASTRSASIPAAGQTTAPRQAKSPDVLLRAAGVDTILVTGVTATACVRTTICDGLADGFRTIAVRECIGDRVPGAVAWNLYDIDAKFADVEGVDDCVAYLNAVNRRNVAE